MTLKLRPLRKGHSPAGAAVLAWKGPVGLGPGRQAGGDLKRCMKGLVR